MFVLPTFNLGVVASLPLPPIFNIDEDTEANIIASSVTNPTGEAQIRYGTDTKDLYVYSGTGSTWYKFSENGTV